jgi:hypothetical protein
MRPLDGNESSDAPVLKIARVCAPRTSETGVQNAGAVPVNPVPRPGGEAAATATQSNEKKAADAHDRSLTTSQFVNALREKIVGQEEAVQALASFYQVLLAGLNAPGRPVGNLLFLGPTGTGKTRVVEAAAEILFGDARAVIKVDCAEFQHSHEIAKLIGSPPGYLGHRETHRASRRRRSPPATRTSSSSPSCCSTRSRSPATPCGSFSSA